MTKKLSVLSIVVVLLLSVCLVGCGDDNKPIAPEDYSKEIVGTWKLVEVISKNGKDSEKFDGSALWIFNSDGTCNITKYNGYEPNKGTYKFSSTNSEISLSMEGDAWLYITKFTKNRLEIKFDGTFVLERK